MGALEAQRRCSRRSVEQPRCRRQRKRKAQGEAFQIKAADRPADIGGGHAFDEIGARAASR
jgi:hypothetical protein